MTDNRKNIKVKFLGFGPNETNENSFFYRLLKEKYNFEFSDDPDYLFYTPFDGTHHNYSCVKIFYTGENMVPNFNCCDYGISFNHITFEDRYLRLPLWRVYEKELEIAMRKGEGVTDEALLNRAFCACVISNSKQSDGYRTAFFEKLSHYKTIASGGRWRNNVGGPVADKQEFQRRYKFSFAFENTFSPGYTTEKLLQSFAADTVPIYYGDPRVTDDFNAEAFINAHDFESMDALVEYVKKVDSDDALYLKYMRAPVFKDNRLPQAYTKESLIRFFDGIFQGDPIRAKRLFFRKPYSDIDYHQIKFRDFKLILKYQLIRLFKNKLLGRK